MPNPIRVAVIGTGAFGRNHLRVLHELETQSYAKSSRPQVLSDATASTSKAPLLQTVVTTGPQQSEGPSVSADAKAIGLDRPPSTGALSLPKLVAAVDLDPKARAEITAHYNIPTFATVADLLTANLGLEAATIAIPTLYHARIATQLLKANLDVLVEKPLTATLREADDLIVLAASRKRVLAAGHLERFNPAVTAALSALTRPMFFEAHRLSVFTPRSLDVDVVLDLMIHDLDIILTMTNSPVVEVRAVGLPVLSRNVDIANVRLEFASGAIANLTASRVSTEQVRKLRLFQPAQYLALDYARQELLTINVDPSTHTRPLAPKGRDATPERPSVAADERVEATSVHGSSGLKLNKLVLPRIEPLRLELEDFLLAVRTHSPPRVTAEAARNALKLALDINAAIATHANRTGLIQ